MPGVSYDVEEHLNEDEEARPGIFILKHRMRLENIRRLSGFTKKQEDEKAVTCTETTEMYKEERDQEKFFGIFLKRFRFGDGHFEDVVETYDEVFGPVEKYDIEGVPVKE
jgi:hypothetical protein